MTALDVPIVPRHVWEKVDDLRSSTTTRTSRSSGTARSSSRTTKPDSYVRLKANKDSGGAPEFDELVFRYYKDQDAAAAPRRARCRSCPARRRSRPPSPPRWRTSRASTSTTRPAAASTPSPPTRAHGRRTARSSGRPPLPAGPAGAARAVHGGGPQGDRRQGVPGARGRGRGLHPAALPAVLLRAVGRPEAGIRPAEAARLLDDAGYRTNADGKRLGKDGKPLNYRVLCHATDPNDKAVGKYLEEVGASWASRSPSTAWTM